MQHLVDAKVIVISQDTQENTSSEDGIPEWIKTTAGWWSQGQISDEDFVRGLQFLLN